MPDSHCDMTGAPSFVADDGGSVCFWRVTETGDMQTDIGRGEQMAEEAMRYAATNGCPALIAMVLLHIAREARTGPDTTLTGIGLKAVNLVAKAMSGASSATTKDEVGRLLASQGPAVERIAQELLRSAQTAAANSRAISGLIGSQRWISATSPVEGRR